MRYLLLLALAACAEDVEADVLAASNLPPDTDGCGLCYVDLSSRQVYLNLESPNLNQYTNLVFHGWDEAYHHYTYSFTNLSDPPSETSFTIPGSGPLPLVAAGLSATRGTTNHQFSVAVVP